MIPIATIMSETGEKLTLALNAETHNVDALNDAGEVGAYEKFAELSDYTDNGKLPEGKFIRWETIETPAPDEWSENELFCEAFGFRPTGPNAQDKLNHGIYAKDLNGDYLDVIIWTC